MGGPLRLLIRLQMQASRIGKQVGLWPRRHGVASTAARVALAGAVAGRQRHPMIATPASGIGNKVGLCPRRRGAASTAARAARLQAVVRSLREDCIELEI